MDVYVTRQPIFDRNQKIIGYEVLYASEIVDDCQDTNRTEPSLAVIRNTFLFLGKEIVAPPGKAFIKLTRDLLMNGLAQVLPSDRTVLEIPEDVEADQEVVCVCQKLREAGYILAYDNYTVDKALKTALLNLADIVKVDFTKNSREGARAIAIAHRLANARRQLLAEKVETRDELIAALAMGYDLFQGGFFSRPVIVRGHDIPHYKRNYMRILRELSRRELDFQALEGVIRQDVTLCYTLLKYINSAYFGVRDEVTSLLRAIVLLGEREVRRWASIVLFTFMGTDAGPEVLVRSLIRGRMCELLAEDVGLKGHESDLFLMGMFSMLDVLIGRPLREILEGMNLRKEVKQALSGKENNYKGLYDLVVSYERGDWGQCRQHASKLNLDPKRIAKIFIAATRYADETLRVGDQSTEPDAQPLREVIS